MPNSTAQDMLPPEVILLSQYFDPTRADLSPMQRLLLAVLEDAIECAMNLGGSRRVARLRREALHWMFTPVVAAPFTFGEVCGYLNIDPDYLRTGLTRWLQAARAGQKPARVPYHQNTRRHDVLTAPKQPYLPRRPAPSDPAVVEFAQV